MLTGLATREVADDEQSGVRAGGVRLRHARRVWRDSESGRSQQHFVAGNGYLVGDDKYLVTVGRFRQFVAAWSNGGGWTPDAGSGTHAYLPGGG
jgi:hypothetical protein